MGKASLLGACVAVVVGGAFAAGRLTAPSRAGEPAGPRAGVGSGRAPGNPKDPDPGASGAFAAPAESTNPPVAAPVPTPIEMGTSVAPLVDRVTDSVVTIHSTKMIRHVVRDEPFLEFLRERMGAQARTRNEVRRGLGSGFIIDHKGTVLTNNHVIAGADELEVQLHDGRKLSAQVVGTDPNNDVAVVRIASPPRDLRPAKLGNSDQVRVGDYVLAIGNPLGLGKTVTMGIVSAKNRSLGTDLGNIPERFQDFIQTDAAINQGNSGGPLFNFAGDVIGVNSAILNPAVAMNVGFAIPINLAMQIAGQLQKSGRVARGFLGVQTEDLDPDKARALGVTAGALVNQVVRGSPAEQAGIKESDIIVEVGGHKIDRKNALAQTVATLEPGAKVKITFVRRGQRLEALALVAERAIGVELKALKIVVAPLAAAEARGLGLRDGQGLRIVFVDPRSPTSGELREGDIVVAVDRVAATVAVMNRFERALLEGGYGRLTISRGGRQLTITLSG